MLCDSFAIARRSQKFTIFSSQEIVLLVLVIVLCNIIRATKYVALYHLFGTFSHLVTPGAL